MHACALGAGNLLSHGVEHGLHVHIRTVVVSVALGGGGSGTTGDLGELGDTSATLLPIDYVLALMALFGLMVAERTVGACLHAHADGMCWS